MSPFLEPLRGPNPEHVVVAGRVAFGLLNDNAREARGIRATALALLG